MILIREVAPPEPPVEVELESLLAPVPGPEPNSILFEDRDGDHVLSLEAHGLLYRGGDEELAKARDVHISLFVTAARFAFACSKYEKGHGLAGAVRSRGKCLVGQVRYHSLSRVGSTCATGRRGFEALAVCWPTSAEDEHALRLDLDTGYTAAEWAAEIARRAARYRLAADRHRTPADPELTDEERAALHELSDVEPISEDFEEGHRYRLHTLPGTYIESAETATIGVHLTAAELGED